MGPALAVRLVDPLGELELVGGASATAGALAEQVLAADPYLERGHRLVIASHHQSRDRTGTAGAVRRLTLVLDELGVHPDPATQILLRNAAQWLGPVDLTEPDREPLSHQR
jgi:hypothetical protein